MASSTPCPFTQPPPAAVATGPKPLGLGLVEPSENQGRDKTLTRCSAAALRSQQSA
jgi:hypothetical protein